MTWREDVERGRAHACTVDESGGVRETRLSAPRDSLEEIGAAIKGEPRGVGLLRYQRRLALEQRETEERRALRRRYDEAGK